MMEQDFISAISICVNKYRCNFILTTDKVKCARRDEANACRVIYLETNVCDCAFLTADIVRLAYRSGNIIRLPIAIEIS